MDLKAAKCPSCGAGVHIPPDREKWHCGYCGNDFFVSDAISSTILENKNALRQLAHSAAESGNWEESIKIWTKILANDANDAQAWFEKGIAELNQVKGIKMTEILNDIFVVWAKSHLPAEMYKEIFDKTFHKDEVDEY